MPEVIDYLARMDRGAGNEVQLTDGMAQLIGKQPTAHADLAMNAPYRQFDSLVIQRLFPRKDVLIHAVDQRAVEVEKEGGFNAHGVPPETGGSNAKNWKATNGYGAPLWPSVCAEFRTGRRVDAARAAFRGAASGGAFRPLGGDARVVQRAAKRAPPAAGLGCNRRAADRLRHVPVCPLCLGAVPAELRTRVPRVAPGVLEDFLMARD